MHTQCLKSSVLAMVSLPAVISTIPILTMAQGALTHCVYICFCLTCNLLVTLMLLVGGSAVTTTLTGMHTAAACFLLPLGVVIYTMFGGYVQLDPPGLH